jgi:hypothetical protein
MDGFFLTAPPIIGRAQFHWREWMSLVTRATVLCLAAIGFLSTGSATHADQITYRFSTTYPPIFFDRGLGGIRLIDNAGVLPKHVTTHPVPIDTRVRAFSLAPPSAGQTIHVPIDLTLADKTSNGGIDKKTVYLGYIHGSLSRVGSDLDFHSSGPQKVTFGNSVYTIKFVADTIHPAGLFLTRGALDFAVTDPPVGSPTPSSTPEPSSFVLAGISLPLFGLLLWRRKD